MTEPALIGQLAVRQDTGRQRVTLARPYDIILVGISWEQRCCSALDATKSLSGSLLALRFHSKDAAKEAGKDACEARFASLGLEITRLDLAASTCFAENADRIEKEIRTRVAKKGEPLTMLLDLTCLPKAYILFVVGLCFSLGLCSRIDCLYSEGEYALGAELEEVTPTSGSTNGRAIISEGEWTSLQIPYLEAESSIPRSRDLLVTLGGELGLSLPFLERYEPRRLGVVFIAESLAQTPDQLIPSERAALLDLLCVPNAIRQDFPIADLTGLSKYAVNFVRATEEDAVTGIAIGSKPHALALGLAALAEKRLEIVCRIPAQYKLLDVPPSGRFSLYEIVDRFEPSAYF